MPTFGDSSRLAAMAEEQLEQRVKTKLWDVVELVAGKVADDGRYRDFGNGLLKW